MSRLLNPLLATALFLFGAASADYADTWGPDMGSTIPAFELTDSNGALQDLDSLAAPGGLILFFTRSVDW